jgi:hypothetical protein
MTPFLLGSPNTCARNGDLDVKVMSYNILYEGLWFFHHDAVPPAPTWPTPAAPWSTDLAWDACQSCNDSDPDRDNCGAPYLESGDEPIDMSNPPRGWREHLAYLTEESSAEKRWENRRGLVAEMIGRESPDILGLLEVYRGEMEAFVEGRFLCGENYRCEETDTGACSASPACGPGTCDGERVYSSQSAMRANFGFYLLYRESRFERIDGGALWVDDDPWAACGKGTTDVLRPFVWVKLRDRRTQRQFVAGLIHANPDCECYRLKYADEVVAQIEAWHRDGFPVMLMGDFNTYDADGGAVQCNDSHYDYGYDSSFISPSADLYESVLYDFDESPPQASTALQFDGDPNCMDPGRFCPEEVAGRRVDRILVSEDFVSRAHAILSDSSDELLGGGMLVDTVLDGSNSCLPYGPDDPGRPRACKVMEGVYPSDHHPVTARLYLESELSMVRGELASYTVENGQAYFSLKGAPDLCGWAARRDVAVITPAVVTSSDAREGMLSLFSELKEDDFEGNPRTLRVYSLPHTKETHPGGSGWGCLVKQLGVDH